jgi:hypothetical protein
VDIQDQAEHLDKMGHFLGHQERLVQVELQVILDPQDCREHQVLQVVPEQGAHQAQAEYPELQELQEQAELQERQEQAELQEYQVLQDLPEHLGKMEHFLDLQEQAEFPVVLDLQDCQAHRVHRVHRVHRELEHLAQVEHLVKMEQEQIFLLRITQD